MSLPGQVNFSTWPEGHVPQASCLQAGLDPVQVLLMEFRAFRRDVQSTLQAHSNDLARISETLAALRPASAGVSLASPCPSPVGSRNLGAQWSRPGAVLPPFDGQRVAPRISTDGLDNVARVQKTGTNSQHGLRALDAALHRQLLTVNADPTASASLLPQRATGAQSPPRETLTERNQSPPTPKDSEHAGGNSGGLTLIVPMHPNSPAAAPAAGRASVPTVADAHLDQGPVEPARPKVTFAPGQAETLQDKEPRPLCLGMQSGRTPGRGSSVDTVSKLLQDEIVQRARQTEENENFVIPSRSVLLSGLREWTARQVRKFAKVGVVLSQVGGVLPWSKHYTRLSYIYQVMMILIHSGILAWHLYIVSYMIDSERVPLSSISKRVAFSDLVLSLGCVAGLLACGAHSGSQQLEECEVDLQACAEIQDFEADAAQASGGDVLISLVVWLSFVGLRIYALLSDGYGTTEVQSFLCCVFSSAELLILSISILRVTAHLNGLVDAFCCAFWANMDYRPAVALWNVVQARIRRASRAVEFLLAALQSTAIVAILALVIDFVQFQCSHLVVASTIGLLLAVSRISRMAAEVTERCIRVPQLINSTSSTTGEMNEERRYLVEFITASQAGVYIFNVRMNSSTVIRLFNFTTLAAGLAVRLLPVASM